MYSLIALMKIADKLSRELLTKLRGKRNNNPIFILYIILICVSKKKQNARKTNSELTVVPSFFLLLLYVCMNLYKHIYSSYSNWNNLCND